MRRIELFDEKMNNVGTLSLDGNGKRYWGMSRDVQIGDTDNGRQWQDTFSFSCFADDINGDTVSPLGYFMWQASNSRWYLYAIQKVDSVSGSTVSDTLNITAVNALAYDLTAKNFTAITYTMPNSKDTFQYCLQDSGWQIGKIDTMTTGATSLELSGDNAMSAFASAITAFSAEVDAYIEFDQYGNMTRNVDVVLHLYPYVNSNMADTIDEQTDVVDSNGDSNSLLDSTQGRTLNYHNGLAGFTRSEDRTQMFTRLFVKGMNDHTFADINGGKDWVQDTTANDLWNGGRSTYLEGTVTSDSIYQSKALMDWAKDQLKIYNHPAYTYEITTTYMDAEDMPERGESLAVVNFDVVPNLTILAEVFSQHTSDDNPSEDTITLGEIRTLTAITPYSITQLQNKMQNSIVNLLDEVRNGTKLATVQLVTPTGANWTMEEDSKIVIAKVFVDSTNLTSYFSESAFIWQKTDPVIGVHDSAWEDKHKADGSQITLDDGDVGTITCKIDGAFLKDDPEITIKENYTQVWSYNFKNNFKDPWGKGIYKAPQYVHIDQDNGFLIFSSAYANDAKNTKQRGPTSDTKYHRFKINGTYMDSMVLQGGGHGSSFGYRFVDGMPEIWTTIQTKSDGDFLGHVKYQPNTVVKLGDKSVINMCKLKNFKRISVDFEHGWVLAVAASNGAVEVTSMDNVKAGKWTPTYKFNTSDYDFKQWAGDYVDGMHELQSSDIYYPFIFLNAGNYNNEDERLSLCINFVTGSLVFRHTDDPLMLTGASIVNPNTDATAPFEPETIAFYSNNGSPYLLQGFDYHEVDTAVDDGYDSITTLWKTDLTVRDDSGDVTTVNEMANDDSTDGADSVDKGGDTE